MITNTLESMRKYSQKKEASSYLKKEKKKIIDKQLLRKMKHNLVEELKKFH